MKLNKGSGWLQLIFKNWIVYFEFDIRHWFIGFSLYIWKDGFNLSVALLCFSIDIGVDPQEARLEGR